MICVAPDLLKFKDKHISMAKASRFLGEVMDKADVVWSPSASVDDLALAHDPKWVRGVLRGDEPDGYGLTDQVAPTFALAAVGSMYHAALKAFSNMAIVCAPVHGFHHAGWDFSQGFCTFNGLIVALRKVRQVIGDPEYPVIILDLDAHWGNGTHDIIKRQGLHGIRHTGHHPDGLLDKRRPAILEGFLLALDLEIETIIKRTGKRPLVLYQAGADLHKDDPYGAGYLTTEQLYRRDKTVFDICRRRQLPCAWDLAGGYQDIELVMEIHLNTWRAACEL